MFAKHYMTYSLTQIARQFGMFFLHDLNLENRVLDGIPDKDDAQVDNAMCSAKHNQR
jgi:hypothetical protein